MKVNETKNRKMKATALTVMMLILLASIIVMSVVIVGADTYYNIRINYFFQDGTPARDSYVATYPEGSQVSLTVTNPEISGYTPMTAKEDGVSAATTEFNIDSLNSSQSVDVYYLAGLSHFRVMYYKQNLYDDMYTRDNTLSSEYTDRYDYTGTNPTYLEDVEFPGFTNLFHEPDAIAADGSTVFRVYYDRNYYTIMFDLGDGGYGTEPVYAKYESVYHVTEPKRMGYTFEGWLMTDKDSVKYTYKYSDEAVGKDEKDLWTFIDENGNELVDGSGKPLFDEHGDPIDTNLDVSQYYIPFFPQSTIPAHDVFYKAAWAKGTTSYSVVYWIQNPKGKDITEEDIAATANMAEARALISANYTVVAARDIEGVESGTMINLNTVTTNAHGDPLELWEFFKYDLSGAGRFRMSEAQIKELNGKEKYYKFNSYLSNLQFNGPHEDDPDKTHIEVMGDGTTRINVYYDRRDFTLKFYYAREGLTNGQPNGKISLTNSTKGYSKTNYSGMAYQSALAMEGGNGKGAWANDIADTLPTLETKYTNPQSPYYIPGLETKYEDYNSTTGSYKGNFRYYYYEIKAKYNEPLEGKWLIDAITPVHKKDKTDPNDICYPGSWATEYHAKYRYNNSNTDNYTIKGIYDRLGDDLMFPSRNTVNADGTTDYTELHYLLSWTNTSNANNNWNNGVARVLHFRYDSYVELLPREIQLAQNSENGYQALIDNGTYLDVVEHTYVDSIETSDTYGQTITKVYGLTANRRIETTDSGNQYDNNKTEAEKTTSVRNNQTAAEIVGLTLVNYRPDAQGRAILDASNTLVDWSEDTDTYRRATIKYFYNRNHYMLKWRNGNRLDEEHERDVMYGAPLNSVYLENDGEHEAGEYRYWFSDPQYFNADLRDYYTFMGWYYTPYYYRSADKDAMTMPADDLTLYAKWDPKVINVSFYPTYNDFYKDENRIEDEVPVHYGGYLEMSDIPADVDDDPDNLRPDLNPPTTGAMFAGWYYLRDNAPQRFDPENVPITALNSESGAAENARLKLFAEWATKDVGKYKVSYVEQGHPENEVAEPTFGRSFVWKTKTFLAKGGDELNEDHAWNENGINWWPTAKSHSIVIKSNSNNHENEYEPNTYTFEYIQKRGVYYRVQYLDAASRTPLLDPVELNKDEVYTTHGSVKEDAPFIPGYNAEKLSQTIVLTASTASNAEDQKAEELETNVITFYYNKNERDYIYEVEYWEQDANDDDYTLFETENQQVEINLNGPTFVSLQDIYNGSMPQLILSTGFTRVEGATKVAVTSQGGTTTEISVQDTESVTITGNSKTTIKVYYNRNTYPYSYQYVDYHAEQNYNSLVEAGEDVTNVWNGVLETHDGAHEEKVDATVIIPVPRDLNYDDDGDPDTPDIPYTRIDNKEITLTIGPTEVDSTANLVKIYYRKFNVRELSYKVVCKNEDNEFTEIDYDPQTGDPLFGGLSMTMQTVDAYNKINEVRFYDFNNAEVTDENNISSYLHSHRYNFLGWYDNPEGTGTPLKAAITDPDDPKYADQFVLTKDDLGLDGELPERDVTYYAVVEQVLVHANFEFRYVEDDLPISDGNDESETEEDLQAAAIVAAAPGDTDGSRNGCYFLFSSPRNYQTGDPLPYDRTEGYTLSIEPKSDDNRIYKYEFAEWWEEDLDTDYDENLQTHKLIRRKNLNQWGDWGAPTSLDKQFDRLEDKHVIAVYKRRSDITELPYTINYTFTDRFGNLQTFVKKGVLSGNQLKEGHVDCAITNDSDYRLNDEFILANAPYESNYGETLLWSNREGMITKTSVKEGAIISEGDDPTTENRLYATITAVQNTKKVYANYRLTPNGEYTTLPTDYGANYKLDPDMKAIEAPASYNGMAFSYWAVRKPKSDGSAPSDSDPIVAKGDTPLFDLCMMDTYFLSPVYEGAAAGSGSKSATLDVTTHNIAQGNEDWLAWTWNEGESGEWVRPDENMTFRGLNDKVKFVRVQAGTSVTGGVWDAVFEPSVWNYTEDEHTTHDVTTVQNGQTLTLTGYYQDNSKYIAGVWSNNELEQQGEDPVESASAPSVKLTHLDYTRNRWTDEEGNIDASGETDLLFSDFEIAFDDNGQDIYGSDDYKCGVVLEYCATVPAAVNFNPEKDYGLNTNHDNLAAAVDSHLNGNTPTQYNYTSGKARSIVFCDIPTDSLTNHNRIEFYRYIYNSYVIKGTQDEPVIEHNKCNYLIKVSAYLVKDGQVTFSQEPVYMCYKTIASQDSALPTMVENSSN